MDRIAEIKTEMKNSYIHCLDNGLIIPPKRGVFHRVPTAKKSSHFENDKALKVYFDVLESRLPHFVEFLKQNDIIRVMGKGHSMANIDLGNYLYSIGLIGETLLYDSPFKIVRKWLKLEK